MAAYPGKGSAAPKDVHIDWSAVSSYAPLLEETALMLLQRYYGGQPDETISSPAADVIVGIFSLGRPACDCDCCGRKLQNLRFITRQSRTRANTPWDQSAGILPQSAGTLHHR